ncbi:TBC1 domain family member 5 homolog A-like [Bicyclus anynana]|uniref:TBC1 domain family member 5 homolog A-like n=1 Tax=Bicyclus anynana TaxID=110368 RepID=A0ABM3LGG2_BICAN|nr:TBC1 domain family member 5 homolog A-like [Bicyclus anynana]
MFKILNKHRYHTERSDEVSRENEGYNINNREYNSGNQDGNDNRNGEELKYHEAYQENNDNNYFSDGYRSGDRYQDSSYSQYGPESSENRYRQRFESVGEIYDSKEYRNGNGHQISDFSRDIDGYIDRERSSGDSITSDDAIYRNNRHDRDDNNTDDIETGNVEGYQYEVKNYDSEGNRKSKVYHGSVDEKNDGYRFAAGDTGIYERYKGSVKSRDGEENRDSKEFLWDSDGYRLGERDNNNYEGNQDSDIKYNGNRNGYSKAYLNGNGHNSNEYGFGEGEDIDRDGKESRGRGGYEGDDQYNGGGFRSREGYQRNNFNYDNNDHRGHGIYLSLGRNGIRHETDKMIHCVGCTIHNNIGNGLYNRNEVHLARYKKSIPAIRPPPIRQG